MWDYLTIPFLDLIFFFTIYNLLFRYAVAVICFLAVLGLGCCEDSPPAAASGRALCCSPQAFHRSSSLAAQPALGREGLSTCRVWSQGCASQVLEQGSTAVVCRLTCSEACGIFPDQGSNPSLLNWQADSLPLSHQGSPNYSLIHQTFIF